MKRLKTIVSLLLFVLATVLSGELYQQYLHDFTNQFYYFSINDNGERERMLDCALSACRQKRTDVFALHKIALSAKNTVITIYTTDTMEEVLRKQYNITDGKKISLFSGNTEVIFKDFTECTNRNIESFYFSGSMEQVLSTKSIINDDFTTSYIHSEDMIGNEIYVYVIWGIAFLVILILTWFDIEFSKKELFVRLSMGASHRKIVIKNILLDSLLFLSEFLFVRQMYESQFNACYDERVLCCIFGVFIVLNSSLHLILLKNNYKQIIYGANINTKMLSNCYIIKAISLIVAIMLLSINIEIINTNTKYWRMYDTIDKYQGYSFISLEVDTSDCSDVIEEINYINNIEAQIFFDLLFQNKIALASSDATIDSAEEHNIIYVNQNTQGIEWVKELIKNEKESDVYFIIPEQLYNEENLNFAHTVLSNGFGDYSKSATFEIITYNDLENTLFFESVKSSIIPYGFHLEQKPFLIYCNFSYNVQYSIEATWATQTMWNDIMFRISDQDIQTIYDKYEDIISINTIGVVERCDEYRYMFARIVALNSIISIFMMLLEIVIVTTIIKMEYIVNAKEYMVKKFLGYSTWLKNRALFLLNLFSAGVGLFTTIIMSLMFGVTKWQYNIVATIVFVLAEATLMFYYTKKTENTSIQKVLKGGGI